MPPTNIFKWFYFKQWTLLVSDFCRNWKQQINTCVFWWKNNLKIKKIWKKPENKKLVFSWVLLFSPQIWEPSDFWDTLGFIDQERN